MTLRPGTHPDELMSASLSSELTEAERTTLEAHLADCPSCRETLQAWADQRRLLSGMRAPLAPRDLGARVRTGIDAGPVGPLAWLRESRWLVGGMATLGTVAAAIVVAVVLSGRPEGPIGSTSSPAPSLGPVASVAPSQAVPSPLEGVALEPGDMGTFYIDGADNAKPHTFFTNTSSSDILQLQNRSGPPIAAALSPDGQWVAFITEKGLSGANEVSVLNLATGETQLLGCSEAGPFNDRLSWAPGGIWLAFTLTATELGPEQGCPLPGGPPGVSDAWLWSPTAQDPWRLTDTENWFVADFAPNVVGTDGQTLLYISNPGTVPPAQPGTRPVFIPAVPTEARTYGNPIENVFLPRLSPDGTRAIFWRGEMGDQPTGTVEFVSGGLPYVSGEPIDGQPSWSGEPLFADITPVGGEGFASGKFAWSSDGTTVAFWDGEWLGAPQSENGLFPGPEAFVGSVDGELLTRRSRIDPGLQALGLDPEGEGWILDVAISPDGSLAAVTVGIPRPGDLSAAASYLVLVPLDGGEPMLFGDPSNATQPWYGPAVFAP